MTAQLIYKSSATYKRKFINEVFLNVGMGFFVYLVVLYYLALNRWTLPLAKFVFLDKNTAIISFVVYNLLCFGIYKLFDSNQDDSMKILGYGGIIVLRSLYVSPFLIILGHLHPEILKEAFIIFFTMACSIGSLADNAIKADRELDFLQPILQIGGIFLFVNCLLGMIFGFNAGLFYVFIATLLYSAALLFLMYRILTATDGIGCFSTGEALSASFCMFSLLEALYLCIIFLIIFGAIGLALGGSD
jgi:hypothetical protein